MLTKVTNNGHARPIKICRHEAAHAVIAWTLGHRVRRVLVRGERGFTEHAAPWRKPDPMRLGIIVAAGHAADVLWSRQRRTRSTVGDYRSILALGFRGESVATLLQMAIHFCKASEPEIRAVAAELKSRGWLTGRDVARICSESVSRRRAPKGKSA